MFDPRDEEFVRRAWSTVAMIWLLGWGFLLLRFPAQSFRLLNAGKTPTPKQLKLVRVLGYLGVGFGSLFLVELVVGLVRFR